MWPALITAGATLLGAHLTNQANARAAREQMDFQQSMSNTAYQRQVEDLRRAGINPMLVTKLGGATTPPGAMPSFVNPGAAAAQAYSAQTSAEAAKQQAETSERLSESQIEQVRANTAKIIEETKNIPVEGERLRQMVMMVASQEVLYTQQAYTEREKQRMLAATVSKLVEETELTKGSVQAMKSLDNLGKTAEALKPIADLFKMFILRR